MEYLVKKINMVDVLGMLIPGGLMLLILDQDIKCVAFLTNTLGGAGADTLIWCIAFLCGSYLVGMLLHEVGSVIEKILWKCPLTNPRVYAALTTNMLESYPEKNNIPDNFNAPKICDRIVFSCLYVLTVCAILVLVCLIAGCSTWGHFVIGVSSAFVVIIVATALLQSKYRKALCNEFGRKNTNRKERYKELRWILANDLDISNKSLTNEENARKRGLFDGYRALMRGVLVMIAITQIYVMLIGDKSSLAIYVSVISNTPAYSFLRVLIVTALVMRYWHYSCTKFTYCYNGYLQNCSSNTEAET